mgnify:FL=1
MINLYEGGNFFDDKGPTTFSIIKVRPLNHKVILRKRIELGTPSLVRIEPSLQKERNLKSHIGKVA